MYYGGFENTLKIAEDSTEVVNRHQGEERGSGKLTIRDYH